MARFQKHYATIPNRLVDDTRLHYTAKIVYVALALSRRKSGLIRLTVEDLTELTGLCEATVLQALRELEDGRFLRRKRNWRFSQGLCRAVFAANTYKLRMDMSAGYCLIPAAIFHYALTPAGFSVLLFLYRCAGRDGRAFPSIRYIAGAWLEKTGRGLEMGKTTVLRVLKQLTASQALVKHFCDGKNGTKRCNSYYLTDMVTEKFILNHARPSRSGRNSYGKIFDAYGGSIFEDASGNNKITEGFYCTEKEQGVAQFGNLYNFEGLEFYQSLFYFDGTGVKVSAYGEPELIG